MAHITKFSSTFSKWINGLAFSLCGVIGVTSIANADNEQRYRDNFKFQRHQENSSGEGRSSRYPGSGSYRENDQNRHYSHNKHHDKHDSNHYDHKYHRYSRPNYYSHNTNVTIVQPRYVQPTYYSGRTHVTTYSRPSNYSSYNQIVYDYADVVDVQPIYRTEYRQSTESNCWDEQRAVEYQRSSTTAPIIGGLIGAALGNELGHSQTNKKVGVVAGGLLGASIGSNFSTKYPSQVRYQNVTQCEPVNRQYSEEVVDGYWVTYVYGGREQRIRTHTHPGSRIQIEVAARP
ncbi:MAG: glycine zipper 2TM domain-containing protein [Pseudomonadota bacterium]